MLPNGAHGRWLWRASLVLASATLATACDRATDAPREIIADLPNAHGLRVGDSVYYQGFNVGTVRALEVVGDRARVRLVVTRSDVPLRATDVVRVRAYGLFGAAVVDVVPTSFAAPPLARRPGAPDTLRAAGYVPPDSALGRLARGLLDSLRSQFDSTRR